MPYYLKMGGRPSVWLLWQPRPADEVTHYNTCVTVTNKGLTMFKLPVRLFVCPQLHCPSAAQRVMYCELALLYANCCMQFFTLLPTLGGVPYSLQTSV